MLNHSEQSVWAGTSHQAPETELQVHLRELELHMANPVGVPIILANFGNPQEERGIQDNEVGVGIARLG